MNELSANDFYRDYVVPDIRAQRDVADENFPSLNTILPVFLGEGRVHANERNYTNLHNTIWSKVEPKGAGLKTILTQLSRLAPQYAEVYQMGTAYMADLKRRAEALQTRDQLSVDFFRLLPDSFYRNGIIDLQWDNMIQIPPMDISDFRDEDYQSEDREVFLPRNAQNEPVLGVYVGRDTMYVGYFRNRLPDGLGIRLFRNEYLYIGSFHEGFRHGFGVNYQYNSILTIGLWNDNLLNGPAIRWKGYDRWYLGDYMNAQPRGLGMTYNGEVDNYFGYYNEGREHGVGLRMFHLFYAGTWNEGSKTGIGIELQEGRLELGTQVFIGHFDNGRTGYGISGYGQSIYAGEWVHNLEEGPGIYFEGPNEYYQGRWVNGNQDGIMIHYNNGEYTREEWDAGDELRSRPITEEEAYARPLSEEKTLLSESTWWEVICRVEEQPKEKLYDIFHVLLDQAYTESLARSEVDPDLEFALEYLQDLPREELEALSKEELCQSIREIWELWKKANQKVGCVNPTSMLTGQSWDEINPDEVFVISSGGVQYCFTAEELSNLQRNPYTGIAFPREVRDRLRSRSIYLDNQHIQREAVESEDALPPLPVYSQLYSSFEKLGLLDYLERTEGRLVAIRDKVYTRLKEQLEKLKEENELPIGQVITGYDEEKKVNIYEPRTPEKEVEFRLKKGVYGLAGANPLNLNTWLLQIIQANSDLDIQPLVKEAILEALEEELPELPAEYKEAVPQSLRESLEIIERDSEASHLDYRAIMEYNSQVRGLIVEYIRANCLDANLNYDFNLYQTAQIDPTPENIGNFLRDIYRRNDGRRDTLRAFSLNMRPILEGTEEGVQANLIALLPRRMVRRVMRPESQNAILLWIEDVSGDEFEEVSEVKDLELTGQDLTELPENFSELTNLERIYLDENLFEALPMVLGRRPNLEWIEARSNQIATISNDFPVMPNLTTFKLDYNTQLTVLPERFGEIFPNVKCLNLRGTGLTTLPESFYTLAHLEILDLMHTPLTEETRRRLSRMGIRHLQMGNAVGGRAPEQTLEFVPNLRHIAGWSDDDIDLAIGESPLTLENLEALNEYIELLYVRHTVADMANANREQLDEYINTHPSELPDDALFMRNLRALQEVPRLTLQQHANQVLSGPERTNLQNYLLTIINSRPERARRDYEEDQVRWLTEEWDGRDPATIIYQLGQAREGEEETDMKWQVGPYMGGVTLEGGNIQIEFPVPSGVTSRLTLSYFGNGLYKDISENPLPYKSYARLGRLYQAPASQPPPALAPENVAWFSDEIQLPEDPRRRRVIYQLGEVDEGDQIQWFIERIEHGMAYLDEAKVRVIHGDRDGDVLLARFTYETDGIYLSEDGETALRFGYQVSSEPIARNLQAIGEWYENEIKRIDERYLSLDDRIDLANFLALLDTRISSVGMENASRDQIIDYLERREMWPPDSTSILRRFQRLRRMSEGDLIRNINQLLTYNQRGTLARILTIMLENHRRDFFQELTEDDVVWYEYETAVPRSPQRLSVIYQTGDIDEDDGSIEWHEEERDGEWFPLIEQGLAYLDDDGTVRILDSGDNLLLPRFVFSQDGLYFSTAGDMVLHFGRLRVEPDEARMERLFRVWLRAHQNVLEDSPENATRENLNDVIEWIRVRDSELVNGFYRTQIKAMFRDFLEGELNVEESEEASEAEAREEPEEEEEKVEAREEPEEEDFESVLVDDTLPIFVDDEVWNQLHVPVQRQYILNYMKLVLDMLAREDQEFESIAEATLDDYLRDPNELSVQGHNSVPYQNYPPNDRVWSFYDEHKENVGAMAILLTKLRQRYPNNLASQDAYLRRLKERIEGQNEIDPDSFDLLNSVNLLIGLVERQQLLGENPREGLEALANEVRSQDWDGLSRERKRTDLMAYVLLHFTRDLWTEWNYEAIKERATRIRSQIRGGYGDRFSAFTAEYQENAVVSAVILANLIYRWLGPEMYRHLSEFFDTLEGLPANAPGFLSRTQFINSTEELIRASQNDEDPLHDLINSFEDYWTNAV